MPPLEGWRHVKVADRRTRKDCAGVLQDLADVHFPGRRIVLVMDSLNTHRLSTLYEARQLAGHGRNGDECPVPTVFEAAMPDREGMIAEVGAWEDGRNEEAATTDWRFRAEDARMKLKSPYPSNP